MGEVENEVEGKDVEMAAQAGVNESENQVEAPVELPKFETVEERMLAMDEIRTLQALVNTHYFMPKYDQGNKGRQAPKITSSVQLNFFNSEYLQRWGNKIVELTSRL